jgi:hypothetical protein
VDQFTGPATLLGIFELLIEQADHEDDVVGYSFGCSKDNLNIL